jgi:WD40 repeat protein
MAQENPDRIRFVAWSPDGSKVANSNNSGITRILNAATNQILLTLQSDTTGPTITLAWSPDGSKIATGGADKVMRVWNTTTGQLTNTFQETTYVDYVTSVAWSPDGSKIARSSSSGAIHIWNSVTGQLLLNFVSRQVSQIAWSADGSKLALAAGATIETVNINTGQLEERLFGHSQQVIAVAWGADSNLVASGSLDDTLRTWNTTTGQTQNTFTGHTGFVTAIAWNLSENLLASSSEDGTSRIWNVTSGQQVQLVQGTGAIYSVSWSPDGSEIAYGGESGTVQIAAAAGGPTPTPTPSFNFPCNVFGSTVPANPSWNDSSAVTLGLRFRSSVTILDPSGGQQALPLTSKAQVSEAILARVAALLS